MHFPREGTNAAEQILSGFSASMGLHSGVAFAPNTGLFIDPLLDQQQHLLQVYDFGLFAHYPQGVGASKGSLIGIVQSGNLTSVTSTPVSNVGDLLAWIQTNPESPFFTNTALYGTPLAEGYRVLIPVVLSSGVNIGQDLSLLIDMSDSASTSEELLLVEPFFIQPPNLVDPTTFTPTP